MSKTAWLGASILATLALSAQADPISWNTWSSDTAGSMTVDGSSIDVTFSTANYHQAIANYPSWTPSASFADGVVVDNGPVSANGIMRLVGGNTEVNTITFSQAVENPVFAIWSLGQPPGYTATFEFLDATPTFVAGGPNAEYSGSAITVAGNVVSGNEGNGTVMFEGTYTSISWTNSIYENWYGFNVGVAGVSAVPDLAPLASWTIGIAALGFAARRRRV